jgi:hypothetical protein
MPSYIKAALHKYQHPTPICPENAPPHATHIYMAPTHNTLRLNKAALFFLKMMSHKFKG